MYYVRAIVLFLPAVDEVAGYFSSSIRETERFRDRIYEFFEEEDGDIDRVICRIKAEEYDTINGVKQPEIPYLINLRAQITHLADKFKQKK